MVEENGSEIRNKLISQIHLISTNRGGLFGKQIGLLLGLIRALLAENKSNQKSILFFSILLYFSLNDEKDRVYMATGMSESR